MTDNEMKNNERRITRDAGKDSQLKQYGHSNTEEIEKWNENSII